MARPEDEIPNDADFFLIFQVLRESRAIISEGFTRRVRGRLMKLVDERRLAQPSILEIASSLSLDSLNIVSEGIAGRPQIRDPRPRKQASRPPFPPPFPPAAEDDDADDD